MSNKMYVIMICWTIYLNAKVLQTLRTQRREKWVTIQTSNNTRSFKFENDWCVEPCIQEVVSNTWFSNVGQPIVDKLKMCTSDLCSWNKANCNDIKKYIEECKKDLNSSRNQGSTTNPTHRTSLRKRITQMMMIQEDTCFRQRAKTHWYRDGDLNTKKSLSPLLQKKGKLYNCFRNWCQHTSIKNTYWHRDFKWTAIHLT